MDQAHFFSQFSPSLNSLTPFLLWNREKMKQTEFSDLELFEMEVALEEVFVNIVNYAQLSESDEVKIELHISEHSICFIIEDRGKAFNPLRHIPHINKNEDIEQRQIGGLGIFLVNEIMDELSYERFHDSNRLTLIKHLKQGKAS